MRDSLSDQARLDGLKDFLVRFRREIEGEASGLRVRFESLQTISAFAEQCADAECDPRLTQKSDEAAQAMERYSERLNALRRQAEFAGKLEFEVGSFSTAIRSS